MKSIIAGALALTLITVPTVAEQSIVTSKSNTEVGNSMFKSDIEKRSYAVGMTIAESFKNRTEFDGNVIADGFRDAIAGKGKLTDQEKQDVIAAFQSEMQSRRDAEMREAGDKNLDSGRRFMTQNKTKSGVKSTSSGLQYKVISSGTEKNRKSPKASDTVTVHYRGTLIDGTEFDSSYKRNQPASFPLNGVIRGWTEGLQLMKTGDKFEFYIPSELAYGESGAGLIGPNSTLIFEVELISIGK
ncbi:FKBP-type peptidyl-prolyl cis-trans isomerase [bacterium]|nr:FKBP-type peptidyl-prolyl cis-trans isomerase [bacterium]